MIEMAIKNKLYKNVIKVFASNFLLIASGIIMGFLLPKLLGVTDYGYYKIFNLYTTYVVFFDLGIANGVYLEFGGIERNNIEKERFRFYFKILVFLQTVCLLVISVTALIALKGSYQFIFIMLSLYLMANNITNYYEKVSIALGEFDALSKRNILKSLLSVVIIGLLWIGIEIKLPIQYYKLYTILFVAVYALLAIQYVYIFKDISFGKSTDFVKEKPFLIKIIKGGMLLLLADMVASLIMALDRQFVSILYDVDTYSVYSFAYSMLKTIVLAVSALSNVIYPALRRMGQEEMQQSYNYSLCAVGILSIACQLTYYPLCLIVEFFLPNYLGSLPIFRALFPGITINLIISLLMINHYKALKNQNLCFGITVMVLVLSFGLNCGAYFLFGSPIGFSAASVLTMFIWYLLSGYFIDRIYRTNTRIHHVFLLTNIVIYYLVSNLIKNYYAGFVLNLILLLVISMMFYKKEIIYLLNKLRERKKI